MPEIELMNHQGTKDTKKIKSTLGVLGALVVP